MDLFEIFARGVTDSVTSLFPQHHAPLPDSAALNQHLASGEKEEEQQQQQAAAAAAQQSEINRLKNSNYRLEQQLKTQFATQALLRSLPALSHDALVPLAATTAPVTLQSSGNVLLVSFTSPIDGQIIYVDDPYLGVHIDLMQIGTLAGNGLPVYSLLQSVNTQTCLLRQKRPSDTFSVSQHQGNVHVAKVQLDSQVAVEQTLLASNHSSARAARSFLLKLTIHWTISTDPSIAPVLSRYTVEAMVR
jgi:hypothetical protein